MNPLTPKERVKLPRQSMPEMDPLERSRCFEEVNCGFTSVLAHEEAKRCLDCKTQHCNTGCPVGVKIRDFIALVYEGDYLGAAAKIREDNVLPAVTGRVCPQEDQCEGCCILGKNGNSVGIGNLERFVADYERQVGRSGLPTNAPATGKKVAVIGSGPAGLSAAGDLIQRGHQVTVFEALHEIGGVLIYGIPEFRLPKDIVQDEVENLRNMGVVFETNVVVGSSVTVDELFEEEGYHAILVATGAGLPNFLNVPGEHLCGVYSANEFLTRVNMMKAHRFPEFDQPIYNCKDKVVAVVGGGNTALDAVRTSLRLGASKAMILYRRSREEMPGRGEEIHHAEAEGVEFQTLVNPLEFIGDEKGRLTGARCVRMGLGEPDASGRRRPYTLPDSEFILPMDMTIIAIGNSGNPLVQSTTPDLETTKGGYIAADTDSLKTSKVGVFAAGDIVTGGATVILAMGAGRKAAQAIDDYLTSGVW